MHQVNTNGIFIVNLEMEITFDVPLNIHGSVFRIRIMNISLMRKKSP